MHNQTPKAVVECVTPWFLTEERSGLTVPGSRRAQVNSAHPSVGPVHSALQPVYRHIAGFVTKAIHSGHLPVSIAGDCCAAIPVVAGLQHAGLNATSVWLDAHGDFNTHQSSPSGFLGGMPLAMLVGRGDTSLLASVDAVPLHEDQIYLVDARELDPEEAVALERSNIKRAATLDQLIKEIRPGATVHVHFDCDVINPDDAPAQSYPVAGGPTAAEVRHFFQALRTRVNVVAVSVCAWDPAHDRDNRSRTVCLDCLDALL